MCLDWFAIDISDKSERPIPGLRLQWSIFSPKTNSYLSKLVTWILKLRDILRKPWRDLCRYGNLWDRFQSSVEAGGLFSNMADFHGHRHLEFLIHLLIGWNLWRPSWIWKTIESIVLETIAYCLSRLLIGYRPYEPGIVVISFDARRASEEKGWIIRNPRQLTDVLSMKTCVKLDPPSLTSLGVFSYYLKRIINSLINCNR